MILIVIDTHVVYPTVPVGCAIYANAKNLKAVLYSLKFSRMKTIIFEDFEDFCLASKILSLKILVLHTP